MAATYTAGSGTLTVASATGMPATGNFRIRLGNVAGSILRVTARAGAVLTVDVEQDDGNAAIGDTVRLINTAAAMAALKADAIAGASGSGGWWPTFVPPNTTGYTWDNQGGATIVEANNRTLLTVPAAGGTNFRMFHTAAPATPWIITVATIPRVFRSNNQNFGIAMRESGTGQIITIDYAGHAGVNNIEVNKLNTSTSFNSLAAAAGDIVCPTPLFLRMADNATNVIFSYSFDGFNFIQLFSEARGTFLPPNQVGLIGAAGGTDSAMSYLSWIVT